MERVQKQSGEIAGQQRTAQGKFAVEPKSGGFSSWINNSPAMVAQRKKLGNLFGVAIQRQDEEEETLQGKFAAQTAPLRAEPAAKPNDTGLPDNLKSGIENLSGMSMDHVEVHYNSSQPAQLNALAHAQGSDIHVAPGQEQHLPHGALHVVQQTQGGVKQLATVANATINCPNIGNAQQIGNGIHALIEADYLNWGYAGAGNVRMVEQNVPTGHIPDLAVVNGGNVTRFGEIKPQGQEGAGRTKIDNVVADGTNALGLADQVSCPGWAAQVSIPVTNLDPNGFTNDGTGQISLNQDGTRNGLYLYHG